MADSDEIDLYAILGVSKRASMADIKKVKTSVAKSFICWLWTGTFYRCLLKHHMRCWRPCYV